MPGLTIYGFLAFLGMIVPRCGWAYELIFGNRPLPPITDFVLTMVKGTPVPLHWLGLVIMMVLLAVAYLIGRCAPSAEAMVRRLFVLGTVEWCCVGFAMFTALVGLIMPIVPEFHLTENYDWCVMPRVVDSFVKSQSVIVYEGLPDAHAEPKLFQCSKPTVQIHGFYFYQSPINFAESDKTELQWMMTNGRPFDVFTYKSNKSGNWGFHPNFALEWQDATRAKYDGLIDMGCHEAKFFGPGIGLHSDISNAAYRTIRWMLIKYHRNLPDAAMQ